MHRLERASLPVMVLLLLLPGCERAGAKDAASGEPAAPEAGKRVAVVRPQRQAIARTVSQPANVLALEEATLYAQVAGYLSEISVDKGDAVRENQLLARISVPELDAEKKQALAARAQAAAELEAAKVELERAESTRLAADAGVKRAQADLDLQKALHERAKELRGDGVVSVQDLEIAAGRFKDAQAAVGYADAKLAETVAMKREAASRIEVAKAKVQTASAYVDRIAARLSCAEIRAPFDGIVTRRLVDRGAMIQQATSSSTQASPLVAVARIDTVRVHFHVPQAEVAHVASGQRVELRVDAYPDHVFTGRVARTSGALDPATRTMLVEAEYPNPKRELRSGMFGEATIELERHENALTLPAEAVRTQEKTRSVFVVEGGKAHRKVVTIALDSGPLVEIASGLGAEDTVIFGGRLTEGAPVIAVERTAAGTEKHE